MTSQIYWDTFCDIRIDLWRIWDKVQDIWEPFVTNWSRLRQFKTRLKRYEISYGTFGTIWDMLWHLILIGVSFMAFDCIWDDSRRFGLNLSRIERRWGEWVTIGWVSKCDSSKCTTCYEFDTFAVSLDSFRACLTIGEEWWHFGFAFEERRRTRDILVAHLQIWYKITNWNKEIHLR